MSTSYRMSLMGAWAPVALLLALLGSILGGVRLLTDLREPLARVPGLKESSLALASEIFDRRGQKIGEIALERRYHLRLEQLPRHVAQAFLSAEDKDFWSHPGVSLSAMVRALLANMQGGGFRQGASTITQQLARLNFLSQEKSLSRKIKEAILALKIEQHLTKTEILELYLNTIYLGNRSYGVEAAARNFFRKSARNLTVEEAALLASLPKSPARYSPLRHPERATERRAWVLRRMAQDGHISMTKAKLLAKVPLGVAPGPEDHWSAAPYFVAEVRRELTRLLELEAFPQTGLRVFTTLDAPLQRVAATALKRSLEDLTRTIPSATSRLRSDRLEGGLVMVDPATGGVLAMQGGGRFRTSEFNRAARTRRPMGHLLTPFLVALALEHGYGPLSPMIPPLPSTHPGTRTAPPLWALLSRSDEWDRYAMAIRLGRGTVADFLAQLDLSYRPDPRLRVMDEVAATPLQVTAAFSSFAAQGGKVEPHFIERIEDRHGRLLLDLRPLGGPGVRPRVINPSSAFVVSDLLQVSPQESREGTQGEAVDSLIALSADARDLWSVGLSSGVTYTMWIGADLGRLRIPLTEKDVRKVVHQNTLVLNKAIRVYGQRRGTTTPLPPADVGYVRVLDPSGRMRSVPMIATTMTTTLSAGSPSGSGSVARF